MNDSVVEGRQDLFENFRIHQFIARGLNQVYEIINNKTNEVKCAKLVHLNDEKDMEAFKKEIQFLEMTRQSPHQNIINFEGYYIHEEKKDQYHTFRTGYIIMEKGITNLDYFLQKRMNKGEFTSQEIVLFLNSMISAHTHLQRMTIAHRDIKPDNILLFDQDELLFKICDVGVGTESRGENTKTRTLTGTVAYLSPELFQAYRDLKFKSSYNPFKSDVFSLGLVFLYFCSLHRFDYKQRTEIPVEQFKNILKDLRKQIKQTYTNVYGISKVLNLMLEFDDILRVDFVELTQIIKANGYLEIKNVHQENFSLAQARKLNGSMIGFYKTVNIFHQSKTFKVWMNIYQIIMFPNIWIFNQISKLFDTELVSLNKSPKEIEIILDDITKKIKGIQLKGLCYNLELNGLDMRQIEPVKELLEKNVGLEELKIYFWKQQNKIYTFRRLVLLMQPIQKMLELKVVSLSFSSNGLTDDGVNKCIPFLQNLKQLTQFSLDLGMNRLSVECAEAIFQILPNYQQLECLDLNLECNNLNLLISKLLQDIVKSLPKLTKLQINFSKQNIINLSGAMYYKIKVSLKQGTSLEISSIVRQFCGSKEISFFINNF